MFLSFVADDKYSDRVKNTVMISGLGKLTPNLVMMGFKNKTNDLAAIYKYVNTIKTSLQARVSVCILRMPGGQDFSCVITTEETVIVKDSLEKEKNKKKQRRTYGFYGKDGKGLLPHEIKQFQGTPKLRFIDVWRLYDYGGLTLLLPYILKTRKLY